MNVYNPPVTGQVYITNISAGTISYYLVWLKLSRFQDKIISKRFYVISLKRHKDKASLINIQKNLMKYAP